MNVIYEDIDRGGNNHQGKTDDKWLISDKRIKGLSLNLHSAKKMSLMRRTCSYRKNKEVSQKYSRTCSDLV